MSDPCAIVTIGSDDLTARIDPLGAELISLTDAAGREYMTDADPRWWTGHAPILFPIVGALNRGRYRLGKRQFALEKHGFARRSLFALEGGDGSRAIRFVLEDSAETRAVYPFAFRLSLSFAISGSTLAIRCTVTNLGKSEMPFSFGFHPAFAWPLPGGADKLAHRIDFAAPEPEPIRRIDPSSGLLLPDPQPSPVSGRTLWPKPELFESDALIWDALASRGCSFGAPGGAGIELAWRGLPMLGVWQKPGARFLCIEPWRGIADPIGFDGDLHDKPGTVILAPEADRKFSLDITVTPPV